MVEYHAAIKKNLKIAQVVREVCANSVLDQNNRLLYCMAA